MEASLKILHTSVNICHRTINYDGQLGFTYLRLNNIITSTQSWSFNYEESHLVSHLRNGERHTNQASFNEEKHSLSSLLAVS